MRIERPESYAEAAALLGDAASDGRLVRPRGGGTKWNWGAPAAEPDWILSTSRLDRVLEHNVGDLTAVLQAGARLADAQALFAEAGQMLALDPPLGERDAATIGGIVAAADSGPLRHRYGAARDLLLGATVALSDGTVARSGSKVIKNVAGYDLAKLFAGSLGTLGTIVEVVVRLHPRPASTATVIGVTGSAEELAQAALSLSQAPLELDALDVCWESGRGSLLAQVGGVAAAVRAARIARELPLDASARDDDGALWARQRERQRSSNGVVIRVSGLPAELARALALAERLDASLAGRAGVGTWWLTLSPSEPDAVDELRRGLRPFPCAVVDAPRDAGRATDRWGPSDPALVRLSRRVKERFDPAGVCSPGALP